MTYIQRRIEIAKKDRNTDVVSDQEFSRLDAPLVLLGEPGAGKTETAKAISEMRSGSYLEAYRAASSVSIPNVSEIPVIDGFDEVQASAAEQPLVAILKRLEALQVRSFVLTCRATDWANVQNERAVENWFGKKPVVGHLQPLNDTEVAAVVEALGTYPPWGRRLRCASQTQECNRSREKPSVSKASACRNCRGRLAEFEDRVVWAGVCKFCKRE